MAISQPKTALRIHLFGQPNFTLGDKPFRFSAPPKTLSLLAYLLLHRDRPIARETLAFCFWPDEREETAFANLRRHLNHLKKALATAGDMTWFVADDSAVGWNAASEPWLDVAEFERLANREGERARAVDLYGGDLLEPLYDDWILPLRERFRTIYLTTLAALVREHRSNRDYAAAISCARRILTTDPWREDAVRHLMAAHHESGDRAGALRVYLDFANRLRDEMGVAAMPETTMVRDRILHNQPLDDARALSRAMEDASRGARVSALPFVGREREMEQLRALWMRTARNYGAVAFVSGEAGVGKTRLTEELRLIAESEGARAIVGATSSPEAFPYQCLAEAFGSALALIRTVDLSPTHLAALAHIVPTLGAESPPDHSSLPLDPAREQRRLFEALAACVMQLARARPLLLILEDLHWAGEATVAALDFIARRIALAPLMIVVTSRSDEMESSHPMLAVRRALIAEHRGTALAVGRLSRDAVQELVQRIPELAARGENVATSLYAESEGNPLLLLHLARTIIDSAAGSPRAGAVSPSTIHTAIGDRIDGLPESAKMLAEIASVCGRSFDVDVVREVSGWEEAELLDALGTLIDRHFVKELSAGRRFAYGFTHHLVAQTLYRRVAPEIRVRRHRRFAKVMEARQSSNEQESASEIARHYELGLEGGTAARWFASAGRQAMALHAPDEAESYLSRGLELATEPATRIDLLLQREGLFARRGQRDAQRADLEELARLAEASSDDDLACEVLSRRCRLANVTGLRDEESRIVLELRAKAAASGRLVHQAQALYAAAALDTLLGRYEQGRAEALGALDAWQKLQRAAEQVECLCLLAHISLQHGDLSGSEPFMQRASELARRTSRRELEAAVYWSAAGSALVRQQFAACIELCKKAAALYRLLGDGEGEADASVRQASALSRLERYEDAMQLNEAAAKTFTEVGKLQGIATASVNAAVIALRLGDLQRACALLASARAQFEAMLDGRGQAVCELNTAFARLIGGHAAEAKALAAQVLSRVRVIQVPRLEAQALAVLGAAERDLGDVEAAVEHMREGLALEETLGAGSDIANDLADLALAYLAKGDMNAAQRCATQLVEKAESSSAGSLWPQYLFWVAARTFHKAGDSKRARSLLDRAATIYQGARDAIADPETRAKFCDLRFHRQIEGAMRGRWPEAKAAKPT